ncbi:MAG: hypothetical protein LC802_16765 [Acidobacteria bacterium]|nr:hypothetical protein [Acidobacteriota bacterium]
MSSEANETRKPEEAAAVEAVAKQAPTEQQESRPGTPKRFAVGQTVCNEKNEKGKLCNGHLKEVHTAGEAAKYLRGDDVLYQCQTCGALYMGPPMGHVRDPDKQQRYVEKDLAAILRAAGGTLPAYDYPVPAWRGAPKALPKAAAKAPPKASAAQPATPTPAPSGATPPATSPAGDAAPAAASSSDADRHRPAAEAQAATGQASAAPLSPAAATASPAAGAETASDLATEASTELTPGAPKDERTEAAPSSSVAAPTETAAPRESTAPQESAAPAAAAAAPKSKRAASAGGGLLPIAPHLAPPPGETPQQKLERLRLVVEEAKRKAGKL